LPLARERFLREAEIAANLHHPAIVTIFDFGEQGGVPYLVQEFLTGEDLAQKIARGAQGDVPGRIRWLITVAEGLRFAHSRGVVHRDIKPSNVRVLEDGSIRLMDFGIAKVLDAGQQLTGTNVSMGTSGYVSPEQLEGREIDHRADIFSFGVMAYELITGRRPFAAPTVQATLYKILTEEPPAVTSLVPECPPALADCIERCLRKNRDERYPDCSALITDLEHVLAGRAPAVSPVTTRRPAKAVETAAGAGAPDTTQHAGVGRQKFAVIAAAVLVLALAGWAVAAIVGGLGGSSDSGNESGLMQTASTDSLQDSLQLAAADSSPDPQDTTTRTISDAAPGAGDKVPFNAGESQAGSSGSPSSAGRDQTSGGLGSPATGGDTAVARPETRASGAPERTTSRDAGRTAGGNPGNVTTGGRAATQVDAKKVLVIVRSERADALSTVEQTVLSELMSAARPVVDPDVIDELRANDAAMRALSSGASPATGIGREYGAGTVVVADLTTDANAAVAGFITGTAIINAKFYDAAQGTLLFTERFQIGAGGVPGKAGSTERDAITQAAEAVARQLSRAILQKTGGAEDD
jgi:serine/threonine protein kinase